MKKHHLIIFLFCNVLNRIILINDLDGEFKKLKLNDLKEQLDLKKDIRRDEIATDKLKKGNVKNFSDDEDSKLRNNEITHSEKSNKDILRNGDDHMGDLHQHKHSDHHDNDDFRDEFKPKQREDSERDDNGLKNRKLEDKNPYDRKSKDKNDRRSESEDNNSRDVQRNEKNHPNNRRNSENQIQKDSEYPKQNDQRPSDDQIDKRMRDKMTGFYSKRDDPHNNRANSYNDDYLMNKNQNYRPQGPRNEKYRNNLPSDEPQPTPTFRDTRSQQFPEESRSHPKTQQPVNRNNENVFADSNSRNESQNYNTPPSQNNRQSNNQPQVTDPRSQYNDTPPKNLNDLPPRLQSDFSPPYQPNFNDSYQPQPQQMQENSPPIPAIPPATPNNSVTNPQTPFNPSLIPQLNVSPVIHHLLDEIRRMRNGKEPENEPIKHKDEKKEIPEKSPKSDPFKDNLLDELLKLRADKNKPFKPPTTESDLLDSLIKHGNEDKLDDILTKKEPQPVKPPEKKSENKTKLKDLKDKLKRTLFNLNGDLTNTRSTISTLNQMIEQLDQTEKGLESDERVQSAQILEYKDKVMGLTEKLRLVESERVHVRGKKGEMENEREEQMDKEKGLRDKVYKVGDYVDKITEMLCNESN